ncbi:tRNA (adenosine(37)-N6)-threonylcarbamoyltransferase complex ATPase subunit type 1 TsaE [Candidatus Curtissbacteria bacterium]|nr:tRNA (adenosine(37)-N6)-threonylcarbamoyltransferase complex ATPase subunit type 1 TsaE [Candidatus Curtissbacteria bacterium]
MEAQATFDVVQTNSPQETKKIAANFAKTLKGGDMVALYGDLGAGKTIFVQGAAKELGIRQRVLSPTFVFIRSYPLKLKNKQITLNHVDLYRGEGQEDYTALGLGEVFGEDSITFVEWAEKVKQILPKRRIDVILEVVDEKTRRIKIDRRG